MVHHKFVNFFLQTDQFHVHKTPSDTKTSETLRYHDLIFELGMSENIFCEEKWIFFGLSQPILVYCLFIYMVIFGPKYRIEGVKTTSNKSPDWT